jgi:hypothetical protein
LSHTNTDFEQQTRTLAARIAATHRPNPRQPGHVQAARCIAVPLHEAIQQSIPRDDVWHHFSLDLDPKRIYSPNSWQDMASCSEEYHETLDFGVPYFFKQDHLSGGGSEHRSILCKIKNIRWPRAQEITLPLLGDL